MKGLALILAIDCRTSWAGSENDSAAHGGLMPVSELVQPKPGEKVETVSVRFRTVGDMTCTAGVESPARSPRDIINETAACRTSERGARLDDTFSEAAMEDRKKEGYF